MAVPAVASTGVGIGTGKINLDKPVSPGLTYALPSVAVFNTGDTASNYEMAVTYNQIQPEAKPKSQWFTFKPKQFRLEPHQSQVVTIRLKPGTWDAKPGKYFAYLEAHPVVKDKGGKTSVKVAAATKFNFTVKPANFWQRIFYGLIDFWARYKIVLIIIVLLAAGYELRRRFQRHFKIEFRRKAKRLTPKPRSPARKPRKKTSPRPKQGRKQRQQPKQKK